MIILKFNSLSAQDLFTIERRLVRWLSLTSTEKKLPPPPIDPDFNVLDYGRTEMYGHLLGIFAKLHVLDTLGTTPSQLLDFLIDVDSTYINTPYHSFYHAADVVTILYYILTDLGADQYLSAIDVAALLIAALCHDAGHPGYSNIFQVSHKTELAARYNDNSVLESYSVDITRHLLHKHELLKHLKTTTTGSSASEKEVRFTNRVASLILSTDMVRHPEILDHAHRLGDMLTAYYDDEGVCLPNSNCDDDDDDERFLLSNKDRLALSEVILHAADISNTLRPWPISKQWSDLIVQEFFRQGDAEKAAGLTVSPGMDREHSTQAEISLGFGDLFVKPCFEALAGFLPGAQSLLVTLSANRRSWEHLKRSPDPASSSSSFLIAPPLPPPPPPPPLEPPQPTDTMELLGVGGGWRRRVTMAAGTLIIPDHHHHHNNKIVRRQRYRQSSQHIVQRGALYLYPRDQRHCGSASPIFKNDTQLRRWQVLFPFSKTSFSSSFPEAAAPTSAPSSTLLFHPHATVGMGQE